MKCNVAYLFWLATECLNDTLAFEQVAINLRTTLIFSVPDSRVHFEFDMVVWNDSKAAAGC